MHYNPLLVGLLAALPLASGAIITGSHVPLTGYNLSWTIDDTAATIEVTIAAQTTGWVAFGIASSGGMYGADIMMATVDDSTGAGSVNDYHAFSQVAPIMDEQQDWTLVSGSQADGWTTVTATRALVTGDLQDWALSATSSWTLLAAMGPSDSTTAMHAASSRTSYRVNLFRPQDGLISLIDTQVRTVPGVQSLDFQAQNYVGQSVCTSSSRPGVKTNGVTHVKTECVDSVTDYTDLCIKLSDHNITAAAAQASAKADMA